MNGRPGFSPAIPPSQTCCKSNRGLELPRHYLPVLVPGRQATWELFAQKGNALLHSYKFLRKKMRIRMRGPCPESKGFELWPSPYLEGMTATNK